MAEKYSLAQGARFSVVYRINRSQDGTVEGMYGGMAAMGTETALVFETADGIVFSNASSVVSMRQLEAAPEEPRKATGDDRALYG